MLKSKADTDRALGDSRHHRATIKGMGQLDIAGRPLNIGVFFYSNVVFLFIDVIL